MSRYRPHRGAQRRRYQSLMKTWRRLRDAEPDQVLKQRRARRRLLEELQALELEAADQTAAWR